MEPDQLAERYARLSTAHIADACLRVGVPVRVAPPGTRAVDPRSSRLCGRVLPARHAGSVDIFLEAISEARPGDVLVVDNGGRTDEACVGDLVVLEAQGAGLAGLVIWGLHRDTADVCAIGLPVFSLGALPAGPGELRHRHPAALRSSQIGDWTVDPADIVFGDEDGVLFVAASHAGQVLGAAEGIRDTERSQADRMRAGDSLRSQVVFSEYLTARRRQPDLTFRQHLRSVAGAIEE